MLNFHGKWIIYLRLYSLCNSCICNLRNPRWQQANSEAHTEGGDRCLSSAGRWHKSRAAILLQHGKYTDCQFREETRVTWSRQMEWKWNQTAPPLPPPEAQVQRNYCGDESTICSRFKNTHLICEGVQRNSLGKGDLSPYIVSPPFDSFSFFLVLFPFEVPSLAPPPKKAVLMGKSYELLCIAIYARQLPAPGILSHIKNFSHLQRLK